MKKKALVILVVLCLIYIFWVLFHDYIVINSTKKLLNEAGGIEKINEAIEMIFNSVDRGTSVLNQRSVLFEDEVPGLYKLGNAVYYVPGNKYNPRAIRVRKGGHFTYYSLYVLDPRKKWNVSEMGIVVSPNIVIVGKNRFIPFQF